MNNLFQFCDDLGPAQIVHLYVPSADLKAIVVVDNVACGPSIGGVRMEGDVSLEECVRLARAMTLKNAAAGLAHGGGKSVIFADPHGDPEQKERRIRAFARAIEPLTGYIAGPDMGTNETCMAWVKDEIGRSVGLPREIGGIPLDEVGATGFGVAIAAEVAAGFCDLRLEGAKVAIQGFGAVGRFSARFLAERGAILVAAADSKGTVHDSRGLDIEKLCALKAAGHSVLDHSDGRMLDQKAIVGVDCDIWVPAARPDVLTRENAADIKARLVLQGANIPATEEAERILYERGVLSVPDFIANAGGVICGAIEYHGGTQTTAFETIEENIRFNTQAVLAAARDHRIPPRQAAIDLAEERVRKAMKLRRF
jgi:glutamate dehydrogenase/leucine dehydrogenase